MTAQFNQKVRIKDGHTLGYAECGDPHGQPVLYFHGMPSSRMEISRPEIDAIATKMGARLLAMDRPGIGLSDFWEYSIAGWPDIAEAFADALGVGRFSVLGLSSGPKYVAACAWKIPQRLEAACIVSGNAPVEPQEVNQSMSSQDRQLYWMARNANPVLRLLLWKIARDVRKDPASVLSLFGEMAAPDKAAMQREDVKLVFQEMVQGAFAAGTRGVAWDWKLEARPWGFALEEIRMPVLLWHGEADRLVPVAHGRYLARKIPNCTARFMPDEGHASLIVNHYEEILRGLVC